MTHGAVAQNLPRKGDVAISANLLGRKRDLDRDRGPLSKALLREVAGARLTVMRRIEKVAPEFLIAERTCPWTPARWYPADRYVPSL